MYDLIVIGAGAAGLLAATRAAQGGRRTLLLEKNRKAGVKILISGGTRCNLTHAADRREIVEAFGPMGRFLHSALAALSPQDVVDLFERAGVPTKVEETGKIFPASNRALDVQRALLTMLGQAGAELALNEGVTHVAHQDGQFTVATSRRNLSCARLVVTTGGKSYPGCGTTGDGYAWAAGMGHPLINPRPALTPLTSEAAWVRALQGVTLPDVAMHMARPEQKKHPQRHGSLLFTHFGLSGPVALDLSRFVTERPRAGWQAVCNFLPHLQEDALRDEFAGVGKSSVGQVLGRHLPKRLASALAEEAGTSPEQRMAELSKPMRRRLLDTIKRQPIPISGTLGFEKAEVTAGGVDLEQVDSRTMESKLVSGLFFAGEILDLDGPIGGYNFQAAFSTGWLAGSA